MYSHKDNLSLTTVMYISKAHQSLQPVHILILLVKIMVDCVPTGPGTFRPEVGKL